MFQFTQNHNQGAISTAWLKLHIWYQCVIIDVGSVMKAYFELLCVCVLCTQCTVHTQQIKICRHNTANIHNDTLVPDM